MVTVIWSWLWIYNSLTLTWLCLVTTITLALSLFYLPFRITFLPSHLISLQKMQFLQYSSSLLLFTISNNNKSKSIKNRCFPSVSTSSPFPPHLRLPLFLHTLIYTLEQLNSCNQTGEKIVKPYFFSFISSNKQWKRKNALKNWTRPGILDKCGKASSSPKTMMM